MKLGIEIGLTVVMAVGVAIVFVMFVWAARKDGEVDRKPPGG